MSAVGIVGLAWALMTTAAFAALSASATARTRHELEAEVDPQGSNIQVTPAREQSQSVPLRASAHSHTRAHWPAIEVAPTSPVLRSSPSVAQMYATAGRVGSIHLS
jgi:hypothetical protein